MPKLKEANEDYSAKRFQLKEIEKMGFHTISIDTLNASSPTFTLGWNFDTTDVDEWTDAQVNHYYSKIITNDIFSKYEAEKERRALEEYDKASAIVKDCEEQIKATDEEYYACEVKSVSRWDKIWNGFQKIFTGRDTEKMSQFNRYSELFDQRYKLGDDKFHANETMRKVERTYAQALEKRNNPKPEENQRDKTFELAKGVIRVSESVDVKLGKKAASDLTEEQVENRARELMETPNFQKLAKELDIEHNDVEPATFCHKLSDDIEKEKMAKAEDINTDKNINVDKNINTEKNLNNNEELGRVM